MSTAAHVVAAIVAGVVAGGLVAILVDLVRAIFQLGPDTRSCAGCGRRFDGTDPGSCERCNPTPPGERR